MTATLLAFRLVLAAVFATAGLAKLADLSGSRRAVAGFGVSGRLAAPLGTVLPFVELAAAALLLPAASAWVGSLVALLLLALFGGGIAVNLAQGRRPDCHCFGQLHSEPAGWQTLARNGVLAAMAATMAVAGRTDPGPGALQWIAGLRGMQILALVLGVGVLLVAAGAGWALTHLLRSYGRVLLRLERVEGVLAEAGLLADHSAEELSELGLVPGIEAPGFSLRDVLGDVVTLNGLLEPDRPLLLLFTSPSCIPCHELLPVVAAWQRDYSEGLTIALVNGGDEEAIRAQAEEHALSRVLIDDELAVYRAYEANGTPSAVLVSSDGRIASRVASGAEQIERLLGLALAPSDAAGAEPEGIPIGESAPELALTDLEGRRVALTQLRGAEVALVFWNPDCGFCHAMRDDLLSWERTRSPGAPDLVVVSSGAAEAAAKEGFTSRVLLDTEFTAGGAFGAAGTPMAIRIDAHGKIASPLAAGANAVLTLLGAASGQGAVQASTG